MLDALGLDKVYILPSTKGESKDTALFLNVFLLLWVTMKKILSFYHFFFYNSPLAHQGQKKDTTSIIFEVFEITSG